MCNLVYVFGCWRKKWNFLSMIFSPLHTDWVSYDYELQSTIHWRKMHHLTLQKLQIIRRNKVANRGTGYAPSCLSLLSFLGYGANEGLGEIEYPQFIFYHWCLYIKKKFKWDTVPSFVGVSVWCKCLTIVLCMSYKALFKTSLNWELRCVSCKLSF